MHQVGEEVARANTGTLAFNRATRKLRVLPVGLQLQPQPQPVVYLLELGSC